MKKNKKTNFHKIVFYYVMLISWVALVAVSCSVMLKDTAKAPEIVNVFLNLEPLWNIIGGFF